MGADAVAGVVGVSDDSDFMIFALDYIRMMDWEFDGGIQLVLLGILT